MLYKDNRGHERVQLNPGSSLPCVDDNVYFYEEILDTESIMTTRRKQSALPHSLHSLPFFLSILYPSHKKSPLLFHLLGHCNFS